MSTQDNTPKKINYKTIAWDGICLTSIIAAITLGILWKKSNDSLTLANKQNNTITSEKTKVEKQLVANAEFYNKSYRELNTKLTEKLNKNLLNKNTKIDHLQKDLIDLNKQKQNLNIQKDIALQRWRAPLTASLDIAQDIYAIKWQQNSLLLNDLQNHSAKTNSICQKWEQLCTQLSSYPELYPQVAKIKIRLAQAYCSLGQINKINLADIDWKAAKLEKQQAEIQARIWFSVSSKLAQTGKLKQAQEHLEKAKQSIAKIDATPEKITYFSAMTHLLEADISATKKPAKSLQSYIKASDELAKLVTAVPTNTKLRTAFIQACMDGATLSEGSSSAGQAEKLRKRAFDNINNLLTNNPDIEKPHLLFAEVKILEAGKMLREGDHQKASQLLTIARTHIKEGGGSTLLTAEVDSSQAFIHWDHGERKKAMTLIDNAITKVTNLKETKPKNHDTEYRIASLLWVRSSMQTSPAKSITDGQNAVQHLVKLIQQGAGKREAAARRMIAIIYGDIGHQAFTSNQKNVAKQYFIQAKSQWDYLTKNWGECEEYTEGERWCNWRINSL